VRKTVRCHGLLRESPRENDTLVLKAVTFFGFSSDGLKPSSPLLVISAFGFLQMVKNASSLENQKFISDYDEIKNEWLIVFYFILKVRKLVFKACQIRS
jgi:hypothetical protein